MALLSTSYHACSRAPHCRQAAYRRGPDGKWMCRVHLRAARAAAARPPSPFQVVGSLVIDTRAESR